MKRAFEKTLAIAKVGLECELKMGKLAQENSDVHTGFFLGCFSEQKARTLYLPPRIFRSARKSRIGIQSGTFAELSPKLSHPCDI